MRPILLSLLFTAPLLAQTYTPNLHLNLPYTGELGWGNLLNGNSTEIDNLATNYQSGWIWWPLTTKGDVYIFCNGGPYRLPVGTNSYTLVADSTQTCGVKWAAGGGGGSGTVTSITFNSPLTGGTITTSGSVGIPQATNSVSGYLATSDWNTFNNKAPYPGNSGIPLYNGTNWGTSYAIQGSPDGKVMLAGTVTTGAANPLCTDSNGGATTAGCPTTGLPAQSGNAGYVITNGTTYSVGDLTTGPSGALCAGTGCSGGTPGIIDIVTSIVPRLAAANAFTGQNSYVSPSVNAVNSVTSSATPAFNLLLGRFQTTTLTANITSFTISGLATGGEYCFDFVQDGTGSRTLSGPPSAFHGLFTIGSTASKHNVQCFYSPDGTNLYAENAGQTNQ